MAPHRARTTATSSCPSASPADRLTDVWVRHLGLVDFRSYPAVDLDLERGITTFVGRNGQGKTNLVEAIAYLATLGSHRVASDAPLVRTGSSQALVRAAIEDADRTTLIELAITPGKANKARLNRAPVARVRDILGIVRTVVFAPEDLALVKGDPSDRRRFLDDLLVQRTPRLAGTRADYERVLKQRNALLKSAGSARRGRDSSEAMLRTLEAWDEQLAQHGGELAAARMALLADLVPRAIAEYASIAGSDERALSATYETALRDADGTTVDPSTLGADREAWRAAMLTGIERRRADELDRGITLVGPHRDELRIGLGETPAKGYASHGESWSVALALRLASFAMLVDDGIDPVLVLDDVFAELDARRREHLAARIAGATQALITAAVDADIPAELAGARFQVAGGEVRAA